MINQTKLIVWFILDQKQFTTENTQGRPGKYGGAIIDQLCSEAQLLDWWHKVMADNFYNSEALSIHMRDNRRLLVGGTMMKERTNKLVYFGDAKKPKPIVANPKGSLRLLKHMGKALFTYGWMDTSACYFIDPMYGPGNEGQITRKDPHGLDMQKYA